MSTTYPVSTSTTVIDDLNYNELFDIVQEVFGVTDDGWGLYNFSSTPISIKNRNRSRDWNNLQLDLIDRAYFHITNTTTVISTTTSVVGTSTVMTAEFHNKLSQVAQFVLANRYTCAEGQYFKDAVTSATVNTTDGVSTRTIEWGLTENFIKHRVRVRWASRIVARHFFNTGGYLTWTPYHSNNISNDIDLAWALFLVGIQNSQVVNPIKYDRATFLSQTPGTTRTVYALNSTRSAPDTTYQSGSLTVNVEIFKAHSEDWVEFIITFANNDSPEVVVTPNPGLWTFVL